MKALVYGGPGIKAWKSVANPKILKPTDAIVKTLATTICGSDLHILKGDVPETPIGTILGHESIGEVSEVGSDVKNFKVGQKVIVTISMVPKLNLYVFHTQITLYTQLQTVSPMNHY
ncbi:unnamed protein product [[Candida] boidinii]|nr:unnamed protein product [[Candida] boidinii]